MSLNCKKALLIPLNDLVKNDSQTRMSLNAA